MQRGKQPTRGETAFTLVETVVAVAVAAVAMAIAGAAVAGGHSLFARMAASGPAFDETLARHSALETLRGDLACALPVQDGTGDPAGAGAAGGWQAEFGPDAFSVMRLAAAGGGAFVPVRVSWARHPSGGAVRSVATPGGAPVGAEVFPAAWGVPSFSFRSLDAEKAPFALAPAGAEPPSGQSQPLPAVVDVKWGAASASFAVHCAYPQSQGQDVPGALPATP